MITPKVIKLWFDAIAKIYLKYYYFFEHHYNINELRFVVGINQLLKTLINIHKK